MAEKRIKTRLSIDIPVKIRYNGVTLPGKTKNLSCGGIFIQTPQAPAPHETCQLTLTLPDGKAPLVVNSEVVWKQKKAEEKTEAQKSDDSDGAGLEFKSLDPEQKARINAFIERTMRENLH